MICRIREVRKEHGWSQEELAKRSGVSRVTISKLENHGDAVVSSSTLLQLAKALGVSLNDIFLAV